MKFKEFIEAYHFLEWHHIFMEDEHTSHFQKCLDIHVTLVNPETDAVDDNEELNTKTAVWLEAGEYHKKHSIHDHQLDCGGDTFEEAIIQLAELVEEKYGTNENPKPTPPVVIEDDEVPGVKVFGRVFRKDGQDLKEEDFTQDLLEFMEVKGYDFLGYTE